MTPIVEEDLVDWEPLRIRFVPKSSFDDPDSLAAEIEDWLKTNAVNPRSDCDIRYWEISRRDSSLVEAVCEHLTKKALRRFARHISKRCPDLERIIVGEHIDGYPRGLSFDWVLLPKDIVTINGLQCPVDPVAISFTPVTLGQFTEFMNQTGYTPVPDKIEYEGYLVSNFQLNHGTSPKLPLFGVTYDDALAYCEWARLRLPSEPELHHFFISCVKQHRRFNWSGECWTTTSTSPDVFIVRNGPYHVSSSNQPLERYRKELHRHHYQCLEAPCFRVARTLQRLG